MNVPEWLTRRGSFLRARALWAALFALAALVIRAASPSPPPRTPEGVAAMLGAAVGGEVRPDERCAQRARETPSQSSSLKALPD